MSIVKQTVWRISILTIRGLVQGVGFRPFIYRIANEMKIKGEVGNRNNGVSIRAILTPEQRELLFPGSEMSIRQLLRSIVFNGKKPMLQIRIIRIL